MTEPLEDVQAHTVVRIVDDDDDLREITATMLAYAGWRVATYASAERFLVEDAPSEPGCLLLDICMPGMDGVALQEEMNRRGYRLPIIILTGHASVDVAVHTLKGGAAEFLQKPVDENVLMNAIARLCASSYLEATLGVSSSQVKERLRSLTDRETEVLRLMLGGVAAQEIAERLGVSDRTVYAHRVSIYQKLGTKQIEHPLIRQLVEESREVRP